MKKVKEAGYSRARISPDSPEYKFADRLKEEMHKKRMTQEDLARQMDVSLDTVKNWCQHYTFPKDLQLGKLCEIFKPCSVDYFHGTIDAPNWDIQSVADFTGLSPEAVKTLIDIRGGSKHFYLNDTVSLFIEALLYFDDDFYGYPMVYLVNAIRDYLMSLHYADIIKKGYHPEYQDTDAAYVAIKDLQNESRYTITQTATTLFKCIYKSFVSKYASAKELRNNVDDIINDLIKDYEFNQRNLEEIQMTLTGNESVRKNEA